MLLEKVKATSDAKVLLEKIKPTSKELPEVCLLQLSMDESSVNWKVLEMLDDHLIEKGLPKTLSIDSCNQHIFHGAIQTAVQTSVWNLDKVMKAMYWLLHESPARCEIYVCEGGDSTFPLRWVVLGDLGETYARS